MSIEETIIKHIQPLPESEKAEVLNFIEFLKAKIEKKEMAREFGRLKTMFLWLHAFEEPFYSRRDFE